MEKISRGLSGLWETVKRGGPVMGLLGGCALVALGVWQIYDAAGCIVAGVELAGLSILSVRGEDQ